MSKSKYPYPLLRKNNTYQLSASLNNPRKKNSSLKSNDGEEKDNPRKKNSSLKSNDGDGRVFQISSTE